MSCEIISYAPAIMPIENTPTAMDATTSRVRSLLSHRSERTLRQRGRIILPPSLSVVCCSVLRQAGLDDAGDGFLSKRGANQHISEVLTMKGYKLDRAVRSGTYAGNRIAT